MAAALKLAPKQSTSATPNNAGQSQPSLTSSETNLKKKKKDGWEMTASEALRVNFVDKEIKFDKHIVDYISEY